MGLHIVLLTLLLAYGLAARRVKSNTDEKVDIELNVDVGHPESFSKEEVLEKMAKLKNATDEDAEEEVSPYDFGPSWDGMPFEERWESFRNAVPLDELQDHWDPERDTGPVCHPSLEGPKDSKRLAILLHGFTSCPGTLFPITRILLAQGFRVMRPTLPGHGRKWEETKTKVCTIPDNSDPITYNPYLVPDETADGFQVPSANKKTCTDEVQHKDDLSQFPKGPGPYLYFADALGKLVDQFKIEHPDGTVVVQGHSLGGIIAAKFAMERPKLVDRLLLMNPMFGFSTNVVNPLLSLAADSRISWGQVGNPHCERLRGKNSGGNCQFSIAHVLAMSNLAWIVLCEQWGLEEACRYYTTKAAGYVLTAGLGVPTGATIGASIGSILGPVGTLIGSITGGTVAAFTTLWAGGRAGAALGKALGRWKVTDAEESKRIRAGFADLPQIQAVTSNNDLAVDNKRVERFMSEVGTWRDFRKQNVRKHGNATATSPESSSAYCYWPTVVTHSYCNTRDGSGPKWSHTYIWASLGRFLAHGTFVDVVDRSPLPWGSSHIEDFGFCISKETDVVGDTLTRLPAVHYTPQYTLARTAGESPVPADVVYAGEVQKQSEVLGVFHSRYVEVLSVVFGRHPQRITATLVVTRKQRNEAVRDIFMVTGLVSHWSGDMMQFYGGVKCLKAELHKLESNGGVALLDKVEQVSINRVGSIQLGFCGNEEFVSSLAREEPY